MDPSRRDVLTATASVAALVLSGCEHAPERPNLPLSGNVVDAHCHLFNGRDLPIVRFVREVVIPHNDPSHCDKPVSKKISLLSIDNPDVLDSLFRFIVGGLLSFTPSARAEAALLRQELDTMRPSLSVAADKGRVEGLAIDQIARLFTSSSEKDLVLTSERDSLRRVILEAAGTDQTFAPASKTEARTIAASAVRSNSAAGATLRWIQLFLRHRHSLGDELVDTTRGNGLDPLLLTPLMVDYAHWLGQAPEAESSFSAQVEVIGLIARRAAVRGEPAIHGMCAYDPLRAVIFERKSRYPAFGPEIHPVALAREAFDKHGFLGLKVYPPMGFKPVGNRDDQGYQSRIVQALGSHGVKGLGAALDTAMVQAVDLCVAYDAPMIAHANNSVGAGPNYGARAEPRFWLEVLRRQPMLRLCLAHMGHFCWQETGSRASARGDENTWEWSIGRYLQAYPQSNLYMDISYLSEVLHEDQADRRRHGARLRKWVEACDPDARHIVYGTDWIMLGRDASYPHYAASIRSFLKEDCELSHQQVERILVFNALRYLGLHSGPTRERLLKFHRRHSSTLPAWATVRDA